MPRFLVEAFASLDEDQVQEGIRRLLAEGQRPRDILAMLQMGMEIVSRRFDRGDYALAELFAGTALLHQGLELLGLSLTRPRAGRLGTLLLGSVHDRHDLGKNLVAAILGAGGVRVVDIGSELGPRELTRAVRRHLPAFVGLSCASSMGLPTLRACVEAAREAVAEGPRILVGGAACLPQTAAWAGADIYCRTPGEALLYCRAIFSRWRVL
nr:cobalamin-dependent protein [uncultured Holophaga sp.]